MDLFKSVGVLILFIIVEAVIQEKVLSVPQLELRIAQLMIVIPLRKEGTTRRVSGIRIICTDTEFQHITAPD